MAIDVPDICEALGLACVTQGIWALLITAPLPATTAASPALCVPGVVLSLQSVSSLSHNKRVCVCLRETQTAVPELGLMENDWNEKKLHPLSLRFTSW